MKDGNELTGGKIWEIISLFADGDNKEGVWGLDTQLFETKEDAINAVRFILEPIFASLKAELAEKEKEIALLDTGMEGAVRHIKEHSDCIPKVKVREIYIDCLNLEKEGTLTKEGRGQLVLCRALLGEVKL